MGAQTDLKRVELLTLALWVFKDLSWVLLVFPSAAFAGLVSVSYEIHKCLLVERDSSRASRVHAIGTVFWLSGNVVWMVAELLWDPKKTELLFPANGLHHSWQEKPYAGANFEAYMIGKRAALALFACGTLILLLFYLSLLLRNGIQRETHAVDRYPGNGSQQEDEVQRPTRALVCGRISEEVYCQLFIGPWMLKDMFWCSEHFVPAMVFAVVAAMLVFDTYRNFRSSACLVMFNWICGNTVWMYSEIGNSPSDAEYRLSSSVILFAVLLMALGFCRMTPDDEECETCETTALVGAANSSIA